LAGVEICPPHRPTGDRHRLASQRISSLLVVEEPPSPRSAGGGGRGAGPDSTHECRQPRLGCTSHSRGVGQTGHQSLGDNRGQVHGAAPAPTFPDVACLPEQSCEGYGLRRFLRGSDGYVSPTVCVRHPVS
jgi:hypothetical protein